MKNGVQQGLSRDGNDICNAAANMLTVLRNSSNARTLELLRPQEAAVELRTTVQR